ncbi:outer membrane lipoprotein-sorting protein [Balneola sp. MJW-20]|uniref:outer membrane lipoprotein-sorting protein n=1 Tax=Gracilimonas aurantiaca TaxID=3234185 RepID=UPI003467D8F4
MTRYISILLVSAFLICQPALAQELSDGADVIRAMHERYADSWYPYLKFKQRTVFYDINSGEVAREETWYESLKIPGHLGIRIGDPNGGDGILFKEGTQYGYAEGEMVQEIPRAHDLLVLGFDVYRQDPSKSISVLKEVGYDLSKMYEDTWQGREVYVIGTNLPDPRIPQFWIDKERLVFVRSVKAGRQNTRQEVRFNKYERLGGGWISPEVIFLVNDKKSLLEEYYEIRIPDNVPDAFFDPVTFIQTPWSR